MTNKSRDDNQRLQDGDLSLDPEADTEPMQLEPADTEPECSEGGGEGSILEKHWRTLADAGIDFTDPPPARHWLLKVDGEGALPLGKAGVLAAGGGTGKTMALVQLALAVATGKDWLGRFQVAAQGNVLIALAEEDDEEVRRRFYKAACALELDREARREAAKHIVALPLAGTPVCLTTKDERGNTGAAPLLDEFRERLAEMEWRLIILDPLARWAGDDAEIDNAAATRFVQAVESLVRSPGNPTVLVAHHSSKSSLEAGKANVRGSSAIVDGFRWAATLDAVSGELDGGKLNGVRLHLHKSNYTRSFDDVFLMHSTEEGSAGAFVLATETQREALATAANEGDENVRRMNAEARAKNADTRAKAEARRGSKPTGKGGEAVKDEGYPELRAALGIRADA